MMHQILTQQKVHSQRDQPTIRDLESREFYVVIPEAGVYVRAAGEYTLDLLPFGVHRR